MLKNINRSFKSFVRNSITYFLKFIAPKAKGCQLVENDSPVILYIILAFRGDIVMATPTFKAIKNRWPNSKLIVWVRPQLSDMEKTMPFVDEVFKSWDFILLFWKLPIELLKISKLKKSVLSIRNKKINICVDETGCALTAIVCFLARIPYTIASNDQGFGALADECIEPDATKNLIEKRLINVKTIVGEGHSWKPIVNISNVNICRILEEASLLDTSYITIQPFCGWGAKNWSLSHWFKLCEILYNQLSYPIVIIGQESDKLLIGDLFLSCKAKIVNTCGQLSIDSSSALISAAIIHIGGDSFGRHVATTTNNKSITLYGPTNPIISGYLDSNHIAIKSNIGCEPNRFQQYCDADAGRKCKNIMCIDSITPEAVAESAFKLLNIDFIEK